MSQKFDEQEYAGLLVAKGMPPDLANDVARRTAEARQLDDQTTPRAISSKGASKITTPSISETSSNQPEPVRNNKIKQPDQGCLFSAETQLSVVKPQVSTQKINETSTRQKLLPVRHPTRDFFLCDMFDYALKDDGASMEAPIFTLSTKPDLSEWYWESKDGSRSLTVTPSIKGRATQFDKDVLIYVVSQMTEALNRGRADAKNRTVRFTVYDYLISTNKAINGRSYERLSETFERLRGTTLKTNIKTGGQRTREIFGIIERAKIVEKSADDERMIAVEVTLSEWLFNAVQAHEVLTIHPDYFRLRKPLERRLYELARKHCGRQDMWSISLDLLKDKAGSKCSLREFRRMIREIIEANTLPEYRLILNETDKISVCLKEFI